MQEILTKMAIFAIGLIIGIGGAMYNYSTEQQAHHNRHRYRQSNSSSSSSIVPIQPLDICVICMDLLQFPMEQLPCNHLFHQQCLIDMLNNGINNCPLCNYLISYRQSQQYFQRYQQ